MSQFGDIGFGSHTVATCRHLHHNLISGLQKRVLLSESSHCLDPTLPSLRVPANRGVRGFRVQNVFSHVHPGPWVPALCICMQLPSFAEISRDPLRPADSVKVKTWQTWPLVSKLCSSNIHHHKLIMAISNTRCTNFFGWYMLSYRDWGQIIVLHPSPVKVVPAV
jgi:hypothetical protein